MLEALSHADILLVPFSWHTQSDVVINTAIPTKIIDYMVSGRPILIYAPKESYISKYGKKNNFAAVVDEESVTAIQFAIRKIVSDKAYAAELVQNARKVFRENHDATANAKALSEAISRIRSDYLP